MDPESLQSPEQATVPGLVQESVVTAKAALWNVPVLVATFAVPSEYRDPALAVQIISLLFAALTALNAGRLLVQHRQLALRSGER